MRRIERMKWRIANLIDRLPGQCWANLAEWPLGYRRFLWAPVTDVCRRDAASCGNCYCGKLVRPTPPEETPTPEART